MQTACRAELTDMPSTPWQAPPRQGPPWRQKLLFHTSISLVTEPVFARCFPKNLYAVREHCGLWPNEYSHKNKNLIPPFLDERYTPLPIGHFIKLHNNNRLNSKNFEDIEIINK